jgi:phosphohistidine phosphatase
MTRELLLLRHGKSDWNVGADDFYRPLKDRGKRGAQRIGVWLAQQAMIPEQIITSPAERALVTAEKTCKASGHVDTQIQRDKRVYEAGVDELLAVLADATARRVMLVGHNPGLEELLEWLAGDVVVMPKDGKLLPTATLAQLQMPDDWRSLSPGCASLTTIIRPGTLPKKFPYPSPHGKEQRDRPAYYYTQSSVIPYRVRDGKLEIMVISSSKKHHLVVPKGIKTPGLSPQDSAAEEALEEAGVEGEVGASALGSYVYEKWGATCTVTVYPMKVNHIIPQAQWRESHRGREWLSPEEAARQLKQKQLIPMLNQLSTLL